MIPKILTLAKYPALVLLGCVVGYGYEWATSPLARPLCYDTGAAYLFTLMGRTLDYWLGWGVVAVIGAVPLYGIWLKMPRQEGSTGTQTRERY